MGSPNTAKTKSDPQFPLVLTPEGATIDLIGMDLLIKFRMTWNGVTRQASLGY